MHKGKNVITALLLLQSDIECSFRNTPMKSECCDAAARSVKAVFYVEILPLNKWFGCKAKTNSSCPWCWFCDQVSGW